MVTQRDLPAGRYGSRTARRAPRWVRWAGLAVFVALGLVLAVVGYRNLGTQPIETDGVSYQILDDSSVKLTFSVRRNDPSRPADCVVRTLAPDRDENGRREVYVPPGGASTTVSTVLRTGGRAVTGEVFGCSYQVPQYLKNDQPPSG